ncbi:MAG: response regulator [Lachnospiraceae bacterium]|nr:response regulator [Lachnospiraceae bacterium]
MTFKVLIVAGTEGFFIKGIETKLKGIGTESVFSSFDPDELREKCSDVNMIIIATDETIGDCGEALCYIRDYCFDNDRQAVVVGAEGEYHTILGFLSKGLIYQFFKRPLDMDGFISSIQKYQEENTTRTRRKSILIVDDNVTYMSMIMDWLKDCYRVSMVNSGVQAITWLAKNEADLILLDYEMPVTSGPQVLEMIRSDQTLSDISVIFLTGKGDRESIMKVLALKPDGYLLKSIKRDELLQSIADHFKKKG